MANTAHTTPWQPAATFGGVIDVSHNNGAINWKLVPPSIVLVFIKATQSASFTDPLYAKNLAAAKATGRLAVPYHFLTAAPVDDQLDNLFAVIGDPVTGVPVSLMPVMVDWEIDPYAGRRAPIATMEDFGTKLAKLIGRPPLAYHGMFDLSSPTINAWPWMVPKYGPQPKGPRWLFWQNTDKFVLPGITHPVDHSIFAGTEAELRAWHATGAMPKGFK
jgi:lysozyme